MEKHQYCVIMAGGTGVRFWPMSRESRPKQFIDLPGNGHSLIRLAYRRSLGLFPKENIFIITLSRFRDLVLRTLPDFPPENLLLEPYGRKTAPCTVYATYAILKRDPEAVVAMIPADQIIFDEDLYSRTMQDAISYAARNPVLVTIGTVPSRPDPNFGYIQAVGGKAARNSDRPVPVKTFTEKPAPEIAEVFCKSEEFFWNAGIFIWQAAVIRAECERYIPEITTLFAGWDSALGSPAETVFLERAYTDCAKQSIDYGVMEKTDRAWVYPARFRWSDIDNWESFYNTYFDKDAHGNILRTERPLLDRTEGSILLSENKSKMLAVKGLKDYIVIDTQDVLLICPRDEESYRDFTGDIAMPGHEDIR